MRVCVYGSASKTTPAWYLEEGRRLGELLAKGGHINVNGGGKTGCMGAVNEGTRAAGGRIVSVIHETFLVDREEVVPPSRPFHRRDSAPSNSQSLATRLPHPLRTPPHLTHPGRPSAEVSSGEATSLVPPTCFFQQLALHLCHPLLSDGLPLRLVHPSIPPPQFVHVDEMIVATGDGLAERKRLLVEGCDCIIALPGGAGTFDELWESVAEVGLGFRNIPIVCVNVDGYYDSFHTMITRGGPIPGKTIARKRTRKRLLSGPTLGKRYPTSAPSTPPCRSSTRRFCGHLAPGAFVGIFPSLWLLLCAANNDTLLHKPPEQLLIFEPNAERALAAAIKRHDEIKKSPASDTPHYKKLPNSLCVIVVLSGTCLYRVHACPRGGRGTSRGAP